MDSKDYSTMETGFSTIDECMNKARAKYAAHPELLASTSMPDALASTARETEFKQRLNLASAESEDLLYDARIQLGAPCSIPDDLTPEEQAEQEAHDKWMEGYWKSTKLTDQMLDQNQSLFQEVIETIDDCEAEDAALLDYVRVPSPPPSPKLAWLKNVPNDVKAWVNDSKFRSEKTQLCSITDTAVEYDPSHAMARTTSRNVLSRFLGRALSVW